MKKIDYYHNDVETLIEDYAPAIYSSLSDEIKFNLSHLCDWEDFVFYVIDEETVYTVDGLNGDVLVENTLKYFIEQAIEYAQEED